MTIKRITTHITILALTLLSFAAAADGPVFDPTITPALTLTCDYPVKREDGTPLALDEIAQVDFYVSTDGASWQPAGANTAACRQVYDLSEAQDGQYYYTVTATDTAGRISIYGADAATPEVVALVVKRIAPPANPTGLTGSVG